MEPDQHSTLIRIAHALERVAAALEKMVPE